MSFRVAVLVAALAGFIALSYEILWYRAYGMVSLTAPGTFGLLLGAYLLGVALGSIGTRAFCTTHGGSGDRRQLRSVAAFVYLANAASFLVVPALASLSTRMRWEWSLPLVAVSAGLMGATLPLVSHFGIAPDDRAGARLSYVYVANIVGSSSGSLLTGFVFLEHLSLARVSVLLYVLGVLLCLGLVLPSYRGTSGRAAVVGLAIASVAVGVLGSGRLFDRVYEKLFFRKHFSGTERFDELIENRHGVIAVTEGKVYGGGVYDGILNTGLRHDPNWVFRAYAISAYHPAPRHVFMVGLASGAWARIIAGLPGVEKLTVVEINPGYLELIARHPEVAPILKDPKVQIIIDDGRRYMARHPQGRYDAIVMNTTWHWRAHATNLLSAEFFRLVSSQLADGGIFLFNTTLSEAVMKTSATVFPHAQRIYNFMVVGRSPIVFDRGRWQGVLEGYRLDGKPLLDPADEWDRKRMADLMAIPDTLDRPPVWEGLESRESVLSRFADLPLVTDDNMRSEWFPSDLPEE